MSTKVYDAYRIKDPSTVWDLAWKIRDQARANATTALRAHYLKLVREMDPGEKSYQEAREKSSPSSPTDEALFRLHFARDTVRDKYKANVPSTYRDTYTLDVTFALYPHKGTFYLRTFCESISVFGQVFDFVKTLPELEDFHYQNQTSPPEDVPEAEWEHRESVWDEIYADHRYGSNHVYVDVTSWNTFYTFDPWPNMIQEWRKNPPPLPSREEVWAEKLNELRSVEDVSFSDGLIEINKGASRVYRKGPQWVSVVAGVEKVHEDLNRAADHVYFEHLPESTKRMVLRLMERNS